MHSKDSDLDYGSFEADELDLDYCVESAFLYKLYFDFLKYDFHSFKWRSFLKFQIIKYCTTFSHHNLNSKYRHNSASNER